MEFILPLIIAAFLGLIPANIAKSKGRSFGAWWFYGWMLFIVALIHSLLLKSPEEEAFREQQKQFMEAVASGKNVGLKVNGRSAAKIDISANATTESLMKRAFIFLEDGDWDSAYAYCEAVLNADPECAEAYLGKLMAEYEVSEKSGLMNCAEPFTENDNYKKIVRFGSDEIVDELSGYIEYIRKRNENATNEKLYAEAEYAFNSASSENDFKNAAERFRLLSGYKDSDEFYEKCIEKANEERIKEEQKAEEDRAERERKEKRNKKIKITAGVLISVALISSIIFFGFIQPMINYNTAVEYMSNGEYEKAVSGFVALGDYKDSKEQIYVIACDYMEKSQYEEATNTFKIIKEYKDSEQKEVFSFKKYVKTKKVGDIIEFGSYEQDNNLENGKEKIKWRILKIEGDEVLVLSERILDIERFKSLNSFLNYGFYYDAFDSADRSVIRKKADLNEIFVLSCWEYDAYLSRWPSAMPYAKAKADNEILVDVLELWTRDTNNGEPYYAFKSYDGDPLFNDGYATFYRGVLPALWIDVS